MRNPVPGYRITGSWEDHAGYSEGGTDYPTPYGTRLAAPAAGRLVFNGWVGSAGRRATLHLTHPVYSRVEPSETRMAGWYYEAPGPLVAVVYQHLSVDPTPGDYAEGEADMVRTGASANGVNYGGDVHAHTHGLDAQGRRLDITRFFGSNTAGDGWEELDEMPTVNDLLKQGVPRADGGGETSLEGILSTWDKRWNELPGQVLDVQVPRGGDVPPELAGKPSSLRGVIAFYDSNNFATLRAIAAVATASGMTETQVRTIVADALAGSGLDSEAVAAAVQSALDGAKITLAK